MSTDKFRLDPLPVSPFGPDSESPLAWRVEASYRKLSAVAEALNAVSDELGKSIAQLDSALKKLNLGVTVWVRLRGNDGDAYNPYFWSEDLGYAKIGGKWGISLRTISGDINDPEQEEFEGWLFNDGPRTLRLSAIEKIPELLEKLSKEAVETTNKILAKLDEVQQVATVVKEAAEHPKRSPLAPPIAKAAKEQKK